MAEYHALPDRAPYPPNQPPVPYGAQPQPYYQPQQQYYGQPQQQQPQQQYYGAPPPVPAYVPPTYQSAPNNGTINPDTGLPAKFNPKPKYNDLWALFLFLIQLAAFVVLSYFAISKVVESRKGGSSGGIGGLDGLFAKTGLVTMAMGLILGAVISVLYLLLTQAFPRQVIKVTFALSILLYLGFAAYCLYRRWWIPGVITLIFGLLYAWMWWAWKSRIPFATVMLATITAVSKRYPATFAVSLAGLFVQLVYSIYFAVTLAGVYQMYYGTDNMVLLRVLTVVCYFSFFFTSQVITNIVHVTISGVFATYYYMAGSPQGMTSSPTIASLKRACTTSLGSICFGSLIIAIIQTLRTIANMFRGDSDGIMAFVACLIDCLLACLQGIAEFINKYAFCEVAIYGKAFIPAAKDTWRIIQDRGIEMIINDNLIGTVWSMGALLGSVLTGAACYVYLRFGDPAYFAANTEFVWVLVVLAFLLSIQMIFTVGTVIDSGVATTFVALAEDPAALARTKPELFRKIQETYPEVVQGVSY
ncbi:putative choline transporter, neither null mutation nor overexpression affects choline transport [Podila epicladia]|nr:putative choline transporter, neither null mutation nor overexpression affects choline transport [Podila epicladia]KAG0093965.1 putative choline transporter, neither null mutation nor overexpression affects choline transport [Podila epicladia]